MEAIKSGDVAAVAAATEAHIARVFERDGPTAHQRRRSPAPRPIPARHRLTDLDRPAVWCETGGSGLQFVPLEDPDSDGPPST